MNKNTKNDYSSTNYELKKYKDYIKKVKILLILFLITLVLCIIGFSWLVAAMATAHFSYLFFIFLGPAFVLAIFNYIFSCLILVNLNNFKHSNNPMIVRIYQDHFNICLILFVVNFMSFINWITWPMLIFNYIKTKNKLIKELK